MSSYRKVLWNEGMLLTPHHFQQWDNYHDEQLRSRFRSLAPYDWGILDLQFSNESIANGVVELIRCRVLLPDGLSVNAPPVAPPPRRRAIDDHFAPDADSLAVHAE